MAGITDSPKRSYRINATAARRAALEILCDVRAGTPLADARDRRLSALSERDRRLAYELSAGVLRRQRELDSVLELERTPISCAG